MNIRKISLQLVTFFIAAATMIGCRHQTHTIVVDQEMGVAIPIATIGDTLEWHLTQDYGSGKFFIHFIGESPCEHPTEAVQGENRFASCKVVIKLPEARYFKYTIDSSKDNFKDTPQPCSSCVVMIGPRSCVNCISVSPQSTGKTGDDSIAIFYTDSPNREIKVSGGTNPGPVIKWGTNNVAGWSVTFQPPHKFPCTHNEAEPFHDGNDKCHLPQPRMDDYTYTVSAPGYESKDFTIPRS